MITEDIIRDLAPVSDDLWPGPERDAALEALLLRVGPVAATATAVNDVAEVDSPHRRSRTQWSWGAAVAAAVLVLLVGVGAVLVSLHRSSDHDDVGPAASTSPSVVGTGPPTTPIVIPIDHTGAYHYVSAPFVLGYQPNSIVIGSKLLGGEVRLASAPRVSVSDGATRGELVITADFTVVSFADGSYLQIQPPQFGGVVSQNGAACEGSSGGCGAAAEPGNVRPS